MFKIVLKSSLMALKYMECQEHVNHNVNNDEWEMIIEQI